MLPLVMYYLLKGISVKKQLSVRPFAALFIFAVFAVNFSFHIFKVVSVDCYYLTFFFLIIQLE